MLPEIDENILHSRVIPFSEPEEHFQPCPRCLLAARDKQLLGWWLSHSAFISHKDGTVTIQTTLKQADFEALKRMAEDK